MCFIDFADPLLSSVPPGLTLGKDFLRPRQVLLKVNKHGVLVRIDSLLQLVQLSEGNHSSEHPTIAIANVQAAATVPQSGTGSVSISSAEYLFVKNVSEQYRIVLQALQVTNDGQRQRPKHIRHRVIFRLSPTSDPTSFTFQLPQVSIHPLIQTYRNDVLGVLHWQSHH